MTFEKELEVARRIAEQAGRLALENHARGFESETKPDDSPVTSADRANERLITEAAGGSLSRRRPSGRRGRGARRAQRPPLDHRPHRWHAQLYARHSHLGRHAGLGS